jgi:hypothetical protein
VRKAIASIGTGPHRHLLRLAARSFRPYARRHGYELHLHTATVDGSRPPAWSKVPILRGLLESNDLVVWLDSDLVIVDPRDDLADALPADRFLGLVEHRTKEGRVPNSGVLVLRACEQARTFLDDVWDQEDLVDHVWWENAAIARLLGYDLGPPVRLADPTPLLTEHTALLDEHWNSIPDASVVQPRIRHYPGYRWQVRAAFMLRDLGLRRR